MTVDEIIAALQGVPALFRVSADRIRVSPLGGLSNTNLKVETPAGTFVLQKPSPDPNGLRDRAGTIEAARMADWIGIGAELVHANPRTGVIITRWIEGAETLSAGHFQTEPALLRDAAALFRRLHHAKETLGRIFDPFDALRRHAAALGKTPLSPRLAASLSIAESAAAGAPRSLIHGDPVPENFLRAPGGLVLIDWEYAGMGDPAWDLAYLSLEAELTASGEAALLAAYGDPTLNTARLGVAKMVAASLAVLWGALRRKHGASPDLAEWMRTRLRQAEDLGTALYPDAGSR